MKRVIVKIDKLGREFPYDFDNLSARDDVMTKLYSQNPQIKKQVEQGQLDEMSDFFITWLDLDDMGQPVVHEEEQTPAKTSKKDAGHTETDAG